MPATAREDATLAVERHADGLVVLSFSVSHHRQNVLTERALADLSNALDELEAQGRGWSPRGVVVRSGREGSFFAGADLSRIDRLWDLPAAEIEALCDAGRTLFGRLSASPWPSVAIIDGTCLGGGLELALGCDLRVATTDSRTACGFPEVKLGLLPAWGGTVRLPRLVGPGPAVEMAVSGESLSGEMAERIGLVDAVVPPSCALEAARRLIEVCVSNGAVTARRRSMTERVPIEPLEREFLESSASAVILGRTAGHYPAPPAILATMLAGCDVPAAEAARIESSAFARLVRTPVARQLVRVFRIGERNRRDSGVGGDEPPRDIDDGAGGVRAPAVVGAGIMGAGIAASHLRAGFSVTIVDVDDRVLGDGIAGMLDEAAWDRSTKRTDPAAALALAGRLRSSSRLAALAGADFVVESVVERPDVKQRVLADIEAAVGPATVITTNTSTNPIARLADGLVDPSRFCGLHFFNPVRRMTLVEVVRGPATADATVARAVAHAKRLGKCPVVVHDSPGFLVNRVLMPYLHEAVEMVREGIDCRRIDRVARQFGMPMGPIELYDMIGLDTAFYAGLVLGAAFGDRIEPSPVIPALVKSGRLGRKSGAGFYAYASGTQRGRMVGPDEGAAAVVSRYRVEGADDAPTDATIADRLLLPMLLEALRALDEGIVRDPRDVDLAVIHALGFPAFRGGLLAWADTLGAAGVVRRLEPLAHLGPRMLPTDGLLAMARSDASFTT